MGYSSKTISSALLLIILGLFVTWLASIAFSWTSSGGARVQTLTWIVLAAAWVIGSLKLWFDWRVKRYEIGEDTIIVHAKAGAFGSTQTVYRYELVISIRMTQGFLGKQFNFGDIRLTIPKLDSELVMNDIENPGDQLREIRRRMDERSKAGNTAAMID